MEEYNPDLLTLTNDEGEEYTFELLDTLEEENVSYVALTPYFDDPSAAVEDSGNLVIMRLVTDENGEEFFEEIEDDAEFDRVGNLFMSRLQDLFDFDDID